MGSIVFWAAFLVYAIVTIRRAYHDRKLVVSAITVLVMLAIIGFEIFSVPVSIEVK